MRRVLMSLSGLLLVTLPAGATTRLMKKMVDEVNTHRLKAECFGDVNKKNYDMAIGKITGSHQCNVIILVIVIEESMEKCMQLAPAFNLLSQLPTSQFSSAFSSRVSEPFKNIQFSNLENLVSLWRSKRDTGLVNVDEDDFVEFLDDLGEFRADMASKMSNLSCVLTDMKLLTPELKVRDSPAER